ncbi:MAG: helix-turn-helix domain-containing protein [Cytophagales bacterium]|jgi:predicted DNA-binding protein (UPF0251 family)|nr:helix-turn-helix domain-containing protein [Cytophagales bacterium]MCA6387521.1 helix-turn-helix domain-containing protein [Cytophagales bacterium]MCA6391192.1 helix-turn-helix domain-containing protein [Cytophagales bacterium]MCA6395830.1 helix-turn-helix domain-containing protein [Cytophagales bacterium]MCA6397663.1 helix-turn-helix domain-containing protein [Cytophagales bacterium]
MNFDEKISEVENLFKSAIMILSEIRSDHNTVAVINSLRHDIVKLRLQDHEAYTFKEASLISKISVKTLYKYRDKGELKVKMGENMKEIILKDDLINFLQSLPYFKF